MSAPWYAVDDPRPEAAWELYHENSKRGPHDGIAVARQAGPAPDYSALPSLPLADRTSSPTPAAPADRSGPLPLRALSDLLLAGGRPLDDTDPIGTFVAIGTVESLPRCLAWYDPAGHCLRVLRREDAWAQLQAALAAPEILARSAALVLFAADLDAATARAGERGYRDALIAAGRHLALIETAAAVAARRSEPAGFYDRPVDALLHLDGLTRSIVAAAAVLS